MGREALVQYFSNLTGVDKVFHCRLAAFKRRKRIVEGQASEDSASLKAS